MALAANCFSKVMTVKMYIPSLDARVIELARANENENHYMFKR